MPVHSLENVLMEVLLQALLRVFKGFCVFSKFCGFVDQKQSELGGHFLRTTKFIENEFGFFCYSKLHISSSSVILGGGESL